MLLAAAVLMPVMVSGLQKNHSAAPKVKIVDMKKGKGPKAKTGDSVTVEYTGKLTNGTTFDTSRGRAPFTFTIGEHQVIKGWEIGVAGMQKGGIRKLTIPPELAYGAGGQGPIGPNSTLIFTIELLSISH